MCPKLIKCNNYCLWLINSFNLLSILKEQIMLCKRQFDQPCSHIVNEYNINISYIKQNYFNIAFELYSKKGI